jgi:hypothetical protein
VSGRATALAAGATLLAVYVATLAPDVTFWDAGEFIAAARVLGIPHPPGTPLFVILLSAWTRAFPWLPFAVATNLFSAVCTAAAAALSSLFVWRAAGSRSAAAAAALTAFGMASIWLNATETEVYAASLALSIGAMLAADVGGRTRDRRWAVLASYLLALSVPLHLSALVAAPAVVYLAARGTDGSTDWGSGVALAGTAILATGASRASPPLAAVGAVVIAAGAWFVHAAPEPAGYTRSRKRVHAWRAVGYVAVPILALSAVGFLLIRAGFDPAINQGNPATIADLAYVVARRQYAVAPLWPRQSPVWVQVGNWFEYADWQVALSLGPTVIPTVARVAMTVLFSSLGIIGSLWQWREDRRTWTGVALAFVAGSLGVIAYLNLKAGPSFGWGVLPDSAPHEARERDYFFVLSFWAWGLWAGLGAVSLARRYALSPAIGVGVAALPIALNWNAVNRRADPEARMAAHTAAALLEPLPPNAVLFVAGDNDTYPLWYAQQVRGLRRDVTVVTMPLLGARWYDVELARRHGLGEGEGTARGTEIDRAKSIARAARARGRPIAAVLTVPARDRNQLGEYWTVRGVVAVEDSAAWTSAIRLFGPTSVSAAVDSEVTGRWARQITEWGLDEPPRPSVDPVYRYLSGVLSCPRFILDSSRVKPPGVSLDSLCNLR